MQITIYGMTHVTSIWMWYMGFPIIDGEIYDESPRLYLPMDYHIWNDECVFRICKQHFADAYCVCV